MVLSDEHIVKFQALYKEHFGKDISKEDAYEQGLKLLRLTSLSYRPMTQKELELVRARQTELLQKQK